jgi:hypothetical protein
MTSDLSTILLMTFFDKVRQIFSLGDIQKTSVYDVTFNKDVNFGKDFTFFYDASFGNGATFNYDLKYLIKKKNHRHFSL